MGARDRYPENGKTSNGRLSRRIRLSLVWSSFSVVFELLPSAFASGLLRGGSLYGAAGHGLVWLAVGPCGYERSVFVPQLVFMFRSL